jgi:hypothetical protein
VTQALRNTGPEHWPSRGTDYAPEIPRDPAIRSEPIAPPDPPDEAMLEALRTTFRAMPRIVEAWLAGEHLTPEDGSLSWDTTDIILLLDPPLPEHEADALLKEIATLEEQLEATGFRREPDREWQFVSQKRFQRWNDDAIKLYTRSNPD